MDTNEDCDMECAGEDERCIFPCVNEGKCEYEFCCPLECIDHVQATGVQTNGE